MKRIISVFLSLSVLLSCLCGTGAAYAKEFTSKDGGFSMTSSSMKRPTMLKKGQSFKLSGKLKASKSLSRIKITVEDLDQFKTQAEYSKKISGRTVNLSDYAGKIKFSKLPPGVKRLKITLTARDGSTVSCSRQFTILGKASEPRHITKKCKIKVSQGKAANVTDSSLDTYWSKGTMTITLPSGKVCDGILLRWYSTLNTYTLTSYDKNDEVLDEYSEKDPAFLNQYYALSEGASKVVIRLKKAKEGKGIASLRVYEKGKVGVSVQRWEKPKAGECDLMVISCHRDDELLFFAGTIPYYQSVRGKTVYTMYVSGKDRQRAREALDGQWSMGTRAYPIFMNFAGGYHNGINGTLSAWGGEDYCLERLVERIRKYQPKVIVTHDTNGEYGHPSHKATSYLVTKAVKLAADKTKYKESAEKYGICKVQKVYKHYTNKNRIKMNWSKHYPELNGKSPFQVATIAYDKHRSQHGGWSMTCDTVKKYPSNVFGLVYTRVGKDKKKNDFFENVK